MSFENIRIILQTVWDSRTLRLHLATLIISVCVLLGFNQLVGQESEVVKVIFTSQNLTLALAIGQALIGIWLRIQTKTPVGIRKKIKAANINVDEYFKVLKKDLGIK